MKRTGNLIHKIIEPDNLRLAFWKAQKGKRYSKAVQLYSLDLDNQLLELRNDIITGKVKLGDYHFFTIYDPKEREICAPAFKEQVLHHALMNVCHASFERRQIYDSYASRKGKGTYSALERAKFYTKKYPWFLKLDVRKFFGSIDHVVLNQQLAAIFKEKKLCHIFENIIDSYPAQSIVGLPIGNLTSQYFANNYLSGLDFFIKKTLMCKAYVRYMDDMILWSTDKQILKNWHKEITDFVNYKLKLNLKPMQMNKTNSGLPFLGYLIYPHYIWLSQRSKKRFIKKLTAINDYYKSGKLEELKCQQKILPLLAFTKHSDSLNFRKSVLLRLGQSS